MNKTDYLLDKYNTLSFSVEEMNANQKKINNTLQNSILNINSKISNPNLLINPDFSINQRGLSSYTGLSKYTVDRWKNSGTNLTVNNDGTITVSVIGGWNYFYQLVEFYQKLKNKKVTLSVNIIDIQNVGNAVPVVAINDGVSTSYTKIIGTGVVSVTHLVSENATLLQCRLINNYSGNVPTSLTAKISYAKLEVGEEATTYLPVSVGEELVKCQRYYYKSPANAVYKYARTGYNFYDNIFCFKQTMRTSPTRTLYSLDGTINCLTKNTDSSNVSANTSYATTDSCTIQCNSGALTSNELYRGAIELDAEMY